MLYFCNPLNIRYRYQFHLNKTKDAAEAINREAADPTLLYFKGKYYLFASMTLGVWVSDRLTDWTFYRLPESWPMYDYAPDARVIGDWVYFSASSVTRNCDFYRTQDILNGPYEVVKGSFPFWDPNLFADDDGRVYFYWGCSNLTPVWGVEMDPATMQPKGDVMVLLTGDPYTRGYERFGEDHSLMPLNADEVEIVYQKLLAGWGITEDDILPEDRPKVRHSVSNHPYIEGAWMDKYDGKYYLQYACPGSEFNIYADGVYVSEHPLGPFTLQKSNPFSYKPGGFVPGAGHGSTMADAHGNRWHASTMRISMNHMFERRVGLWPAGFDVDGELFCNQRYGDWPMKITGEKQDPWQEPEWMLLSCRKKATASSWQEGHEPEKAADENVRTWWRAKSNRLDEYLQLDLGAVCDVHAVQINFADDRISEPLPKDVRGTAENRYIDEFVRMTRWKLEASLEGENWFVLEDKSQADTDLSHDLVVREEGIKARFLRLSQMEVPFGQPPCISGLRVFGHGTGNAPQMPAFCAKRMGDMDVRVMIEAQPETVGYNILFGYRADKLYHSMMVFDAGVHNVGALVKGQSCFIRVDAFNENGIVKGKCIEL